VLLATAVAAFVTACSTGSSEPYARLHDAAPTADGGSIVMLVESGTARLRGSTFSATWDHEVSDLALWRLDRQTGRLVRSRDLPLPPSMRPFYGELRLADQAGVAEAFGEPLRRCAAVLTRCAIQVAPDAYLAEDLRGGSSRGLTLVDPRSGVQVRGEDRGLVAEPWAARTAEAMQAQAVATMRARVQRLYDVARAALATSIAASGGLPRERSPTIIDSGIAQGVEGLTPQYHLEPDGTIVARLAYGDDPPTSLRWTPTGERDATGMPLSFRCEGDRAIVSRWFDGCRFTASPETFDPEITYLLERTPALRAAAAADEAWQKRRRGTTFAVRSSDADAGEVWVACLGKPGSRVGQCDAQHGDTECDVRLPLLCLEPDPQARSSNEDPTIAERWLAARVAASQPVSGESLRTRADADRRCAAEFGAGWRVARWTDRGDGFIARGRVSAERRLWIDSTDVQAANCWASAP
jgi:hypothetical protein